MSRNSNNRGGCLGICEVLTIVFIVLKLVKVIDWSWLWVLSPEWIGITVGVVLVILRGLIERKSDMEKWSDRIKW